MRITQRNGLEPVAAEPRCLLCIGIRPGTRGESERAAVHPLGEGQLPPSRHEKRKGSPRPVRPSQARGIAENPQWGTWGQEMHNAQCSRGRGWERVRFVCQVKRGSQSKARKRSRVRCSPPRQARRETSHVGFPFSTNGGPPKSRRCRATERQARRFRQPFSCLFGHKTRINRTQQKSTARMLLQ